ncbi:MAG: DUF4290 domain-containing protein [Bacteroidota bacterium]
MKESLEYNTERNHMNISEYGRNIQKMVEYAVAEADREKRNRLAQALIALMGNLNPHLRDVVDYKHKLWDHLFIISDFKLDVDSPYPIPTPETIFSKPETVGYTQQKIKFRFYGKNVELMIQKAIEMEDGPVKVAYINMIGSFMKNACRNWNDEMLEDDQILTHLEMLSGGKIKLVEKEGVEFKSFEQRGGGNIPRNKNFKHRNNNNNNNQNRNRNNNPNNNNGGKQNFRPFKKNNNNNNNRGV